MASIEPDSATIDAWLAGELPEAAAAAVERYFDEHPELLPGAEGLPEEAFLDELSTEEVGPRVNELINRIKTSHPTAEQVMPSKDAWREVLTPSDDPELLGTLGHYEVLEVIATGGMGIVFKALDPELDRIAAVKVLAPELAINATARERFLREARAAAKLEHENVLSIYGVHEAGVPYFAMRHAPGGTLQDKLDAGEEFGIEALKSIARQVAAALSAAHEHGLIHRDIKPANILFDEESEQLWVCDFGIARSTEDPSLTYPGAIAGTPQFMSPEQAAGEELDGRSDLFSLGAVLHRCATGIHAFSGETTAAVLGQLGNDQPTTISPPTAKLPAWFERLLENLLAKDPRDRPRNAEMVIRAIDDEFSPQPKHTARRNRRFAIAGITIGSLGLLIFGLLQVPAVENGVNAALGARRGQFFTIDGRVGAWDSIKGAVRAASDGATIELPGGEPIDIGALRLASGKALTFAPMEAGTRPVLTTAVSGEAGIVSLSPLTLTGLQFELNPARGGEGIVVMEDAGVRIENCRFFSRRSVRDPSELRKPAAIELRGTASIEIDGSEFYLEETNGINVVPARSRIRIRDSHLAAFYAIDVREPHGSKGNLGIEVSGSRFRNQHFLKVHPGGAAVRIECESSESEFVTVRPFCWFETDDVGGIRSRVSWKGEGNRFPIGNDRIQIGSKRPVHEAVSLSPLARFAQGQTGADPWSITDVASGRTFTDFSHAFESLPSGSTLELSGLITTSKFNLAPRDKEFHLRSAPGERATVVTRNWKDHTFFLFGSSTLTGLRFVRFDARISSHPIVGIKDGDPVVTDCEFITGPVAPDGSMAGRGLSLTDAGNGLVRRCLFIGGRGFLGAMDDTADGPAEGSVHLEECVFMGHTGIEYAGRTEGKSLAIDAARCVFASDFLLGQHKAYPLRPVRLNVTDSILDLRRSLFYINGSFESDGDKISWTGERNSFRGSVRAWENMEKPSGVEAKQSAALDNLESFFAAYPESFTESGSDFGEPFDRTRVLVPSTPEDLKAALLDAAGTEAAEVLDLFSAAKAAE